MNAPDTYRGWELNFDPPPIPFRGVDWSATHPDYDGEGDARIIRGPSKGAVMIEIDQWLDDDMPDLLDCGDAA